MNIFCRIVCFFCGHEPYRITWNNASYIRMKRKGGQNEVSIFINIILSIIESIALDVANF